MERGRIIEAIAIVLILNMEQNLTDVIIKTLDFTAYLENLELLGKLTGVREMSVVWVINALPYGLLLALRDRKLLTSLQFDVICGC